jgi:hypothetical protein
LEIVVGTLKDMGDELVSFLEPRMGAKLKMSGGSIEVPDEQLRKGVRPRHVKTYIKRFLYMKGVRKKYRVFVSGSEVTVQEIEVKEEEEKEEKKEKEEKTEKAEAVEEPPQEEEKPKAAPKKAKASRKKKEEPKESDS